ncbi:hypothetical protein AHIS2_p033 [Acaryochloris phage A-HIS2]|nr:hypothetical protein AHIS2_p033 [Acaryochloris phage A-HIS2]
MTLVRLCVILGLTQNILHLRGKLLNTIDFTINNSILSALAAKSWKDQMTVFPNARLKGALRSTIERAYSALTGKPLDNEGNTWTIKADSNGAFKALYGPAVYHNGESLVVRWGQEYINIVPREISSRGKTKNYELFVENPGLDPDEAPYLEGITFVEIPFGETDFDVRLRFTLFDAQSDETFVFEFPVWSTDNENKAHAEKLNATVKRSPEKLAEYIAQPASRFEGPTLDFRNKEETHEGEYSVIGVRSFDGNYGKAFVLLVDVENDDHYDFPQFEAFVTKRSAAYNALLMSPVITPEKPAKLFISNQRSGVGKQSGRAWSDVDMALSFDESVTSQVSDDLDLDF